MKKFIFGLLLSGLIATSVFAEESKVSVAESGAIKSALEALVGKSATVTTNNGEAVTGVVEAIGPDAVKIAQLSGKEFYSAVIALNSVTTVVYRAK